MMQKRCCLIALFVAGVFIAVCGLGLWVFAQSIPIELQEGIIPQQGEGSTFGRPQPPPNANGDAQQGRSGGVENTNFDKKGNPRLSEGSVWAGPVDPPEWADNYDVPEGGTWFELRDSSGNTIGYQYQIRGADGKPIETYRFDAEGNLESHVKWNPNPGFWVIQPDDPRAGNTNFDRKGNPRLPEGSVWSTRVDAPEWADNYDVPEGGMWYELHDSNGNIIGYQYQIIGADLKPFELYKFDAEGNLESHVKWNPDAGFWVIQPDDPRAGTAHYDSPVGSGR